MEYGNEEHLDLRQRKTRALLVKALAELMEERPFSELSVVDICSRAMVHRTTFYAHFNDKQELLRYLLHGLERECADPCLPQDPARALYRVASQILVSLAEKKHPDMDYQPVRDILKEGSRP